MVRYQAKHSTERTEKRQTDGKKLRKSTTIDKKPFQVKMRGATSYISIRETIILQTITI